jgi:ATP-dependent Lon protease
MANIYDEKINFYKLIIDNIQYGLQQYKLNNIITSNDCNLCINNLEKIISLINNINEDNILNELQYINNSLSSVIKNNGIYNFDNFLKICIGNNFYDKLFNSSELQHKYELIKKYLHPINYKIINWNNKKNNGSKEVAKNKILDDKILVEESNMLECFDLMRSESNFNLRVRGIKVIIHDVSNKKSLNINCIIDDILLNNFNFKYLENRKKSLNDYIRNIGSKNEIYNENIWNNFNNILNIKEFLIYSNQEIFNKYVHIINQSNNFEQKTINGIVQEFIGSDLFTQRSMLIILLLNTHNQEFQYISYLLYDLLSNDNQNNSDSFEQKKIYDSLPWNCKKFFKDAMYKTIEYTTNLSNFDNNKIPLEQQICLMKVKDSVKEKAMQKLKEIKSKSEDSGSKARQYLDGLLKIPFGIYKEEYILTKKSEIHDLFKLLVETIKNINIDKLENEELIKFLNNITFLLNDKNEYNSIEIINIINILEKELEPHYNIIFKFLLENIGNKKKITHLLTSINMICKKYNIQELKFDKNNFKLCIDNFLNANINNIYALKEILVVMESMNNNTIYTSLINIEKNITKIKQKNDFVIEYISDFNNILNKSIHGHDNAKKQIERVLGQWINGEKTGYCFGFEGAPGLGKTTLAKKGLANCLKDINGEARPYSFIAIGGSSNGSTLDGHNYTYVGSTWGKIVDILIEKQCMNPIIFIDELDKVSKTEHGKEIIGILTHLIDSTQNDTFQDKYFSNIDLDLSKALFIFSYNDVELIDKILLDRIHRIKFDNLLLEDKLIISRDYILPELYKKFGLVNIIEFDEKLLEFIISNYTNEPGVRKLKEVLFEIISSINLDLLKNINSYNIPVIISKELIETILCDRHQTRIVKINDKSKVGIVNGMWANSLGNGGILHIESKFFHTNTFMELKLTGMQGDVMKESMTVSKTLALSLLDKKVLNNIMKNFEETKMQGFHLHVPEGATPKDGPSAGAAITLVLYSLLTNKKIKNTFAITGEINLQGNITAIGGLDLKFLGGIKAGVKTFLYPKDNEKDFLLYCKKHSSLVEKYKYISVSHISEVLKLMLE